MKRILILVSSAAAIVVAVLVVVPMLVPASAVKGELAEYVRQTTGRKLAIEGDGSFRLFPSAGVTFERVRLSGPDGNPDTPFLTAETITAELSLFSLTAGGIVFDALTLKRAVIDLREDADGRGNWQFGEAAPGALARPARAVQAGFAGADARLGIRRITLRDSALRYHAGGATPVELSGANLVLRWPQPASAATLTGSFVLRGSEITVEAGLETPQRLRRGERAQLVADLTSAFANLRFDGHVLPDGSRRIDGTLKASSDDPGALFAAAGASVTPAITTFSIEGRLAAQPGEARLSGLHAVIDTMTARGELALKDGDTRPMLSGRLDFDTLDLDRLALVPVPKPADTAMLDGGGLWPARANTPDQPRLRVDGLDALDAELALTAQALKRKALSGGDADLRAQIDNGELRLDLSSLSLYGGRAAGHAELSGHDGVPVISARLEVSDVSALPLFRDAASFDWVSGTMSGTVNLASGGETLDGLRERLQGEAEMRMRDGALEGLDLPEILARLQDGDISEPERREGDQTRFTQLAATWAIQQGMAETADLRLEGPYLSAKGAGTVDLRRERIDMRLKPRIAARTGEAEAAEAMEVPLVVAGRWDEPKIYPDVQEVLKDPQKSLGAAKNFGKAVERITGGKVSEDDFRNAIEGLLGGNKN